MYAVFRINPIRLIAVLLAALLAPAVAQAQDNNPPEDNQKASRVEARFAALKTYGEIMGFYLGAGAPDPENTPIIAPFHWQGIQRSAGTGTPYFFVSRSGKDEAGKHANIAVVEMLSRNKDGGRLRSNRLNTTSQPLDTAPPAMDRVVHNIEFTDYNHVGGMQRIGNILVVPLEGRNDDNNPEGKVVFYDVKDPRSPVRLPGEIHVNHDCGVVGIAKIPNDGRYLIALTWGYNLYVEFWRSNGTDLHASNLSFTRIYEWFPDEHSSVDWKTGIYWNWLLGMYVFRGTYQCLNFIVQTDGVPEHDTLYLIGTRNTSPINNGDDMMQLFKVTVHENNKVDIENAGEERHMYCRDGNGNFNAAAGLHITPNGEFILYSTEHDNAGPGGCIKMAEFGDLLGGDSDRTPAVAWVEFHEDTQFAGRKLLFDSRDSIYQDWNNFGTVDNFNDKASSLIWYAPVGTTMRCYKDVDYSGDYFDLVGSGQVQSIPNLGASGWNDKISSVMIISGDPGQTIITPTARFPDLPSAYDTLMSVIGSKPYNRLQIYTGNYDYRLRFSVTTRIEALGGSVVIGAP